MLSNIHVTQRQLNRLAKARRAYVRVLRRRGWTMARIGKELGVSRQRVGQMAGKR